MNNKWEETNYKADQFNETLDSGFKKLNETLDSTSTVSYTHLDVYKRQAIMLLNKQFKKIY